jgi:L-asparagine transporter-like permease
MNKWNKYLVIGVLIWVLIKFVDSSQTAIIYIMLFAGLPFVIYGLIIFFKDKKEKNANNEK